MRASALTCAAIGLLAAGAASAQTAGWSGQATIYGWLPVINGSQEGPDGEPLIELDSADVLSALDMAFMGNAQFQRDRFGFFLDAVYAQLSTDGEWIQERVSTETKTRLGLYTAAVTWRVHEDARGFLDVYGGARHFDTRVEFEIGSANLGEASFSKNLNWTDAIVGLRGRVNLNDRWSLNGFADYGGFDGADDQSWELYAGANYSFSHRWEGVLGYRYVSIQKKVTDRASLDIDLQGPVLGVTYKF
jgi:opacity protein-like surface antigen